MKITKAPWRRGSIYNNSSEIFSGRNVVARVYVWHTPKNEKLGFTTNELLDRQAELIGNANLICTAPRMAKFIERLADLPNDYFGSDVWSEIDEILQDLTRY